MGNHVIALTVVALTVGVQEILTLLLLGGILAGLWLVSRLKRKL